MRATTAAVVVAAALVSGCRGGSDVTAPTATSTNETDPPSTTVTSPTRPGNGDATDSTATDSTATEGIGPDEDLFTRQMAVLHGPDGETCDVCVWVADSSIEHRTGLANVTTVGDADGMVFLFDPPTSSSFWMKNVVFDLDIVFFDPDGVKVGSEEMTPCVTTNCELYGPGVPYSTAFEYEPDRLDELGMSEVERFELSDVSCDRGPSVLK